MATANAQQPGSQQANVYGGKDRSKGDVGMESDSTMDGLKDAVKSGAQTLQHNAERAMEGVSEYGTKINETYLKPYERAVTDFVKNRPITSVLIGGSIGFIAARLIQRSAKRVNIQ